MSVLMPLGLHAQVLPSFGDSRTGTTGMQFLKVAPDAEGTAMAGSYVAVADGINSLYWNPAGITQLKDSRWGVLASHAQYFAGVDLNYAGVTYSQNEIRYWGLSVLSMVTPEMPVTTVFDPDGTGETFQGVGLVIAGTYAQVLTDNFSFGITGKYAMEGMAGVATRTGMFDLGFRYDLNLAHTRFAATISNFGFNVEPDGEVTLLTLNGSREVDNFEEVAVPAIFRLGVAIDPIHTEETVWTLSGQLNHPTDNNETVSLGTEVMLRNLIMLRAGYEFGADEGGFPAIGAGVKLRRRFGSLGINYSYNNRRHLGGVHRVGAQILLRNKNQDTPAE